jgi:hypothetical protein
MSFWNNPEKNSLKMLMLVVVVAGAGLFVYKNMQSSALGGEGKVISTGAPSVSTTGTPGTAKPKCEDAGPHTGGAPGDPGGCHVADGNCHSDFGTIDTENGCCQTKSACINFFPNGGGDPGDEGKINPTGGTPGTINNTSAGTQKSGSGNVAPAK